MNLCSRCGLDKQSFLHSYVCVAGPVNPNISKIYLNDLGERVEESDAKYTVTFDDGKYTLSIDVRTNLSISASTGSDTVREMGIAYLALADEMERNGH